MPYSPNLRIELIDTGTQAGTWGTTTNTNLGTLIEDAIAGYTSVSVTSANQAFTAVDGAADQSRNMSIALTTTTGANFAVYAPPAEKVYVIRNASSYTATIYNSTVIGNTTAAGLGVAIPAGKTQAVWSDGTNFRLQNDYVAGDVVGNVTGNLNGNLTAAAPTAPTQPTLTNDTSIATTAFVQAVVSTARGALYPVGSIYINATDNTNPNSLLGFGTWVAFGAGRVPVGFNAANPLFDAAEKTGGSADAITVSHTHTFSATTSTAGAHAHTGSLTQSTKSGTGPTPVVSSTESFGGNYNYTTNSAGDHNHTVSGTTSSTGSSGTNANYQPFITVYMWKRTA